MSNRPYLGLALAFLFSFFAGGIVVWAWATTTKMPATGSSSPTTPSASDAEHPNRLEKFFHGDQGRNVRNGQEMKPRW
ncbi:entry exclusion protein TrbK [Mesorhizobium sp. BH1-1-4]|uniref:entry exclusion protein TrbK n=1 Tax=Mesorhizobium sp. BH1-1-4 TaxID=2876662 RepID=UPI001CD17CBB|nr:entry exclusion protein TrbK [Mesorhizobium sp. BH1-1-4]MBZ9994101.1 entry exclusion protein TrbK [Mesorhizobium sp. BH1-1-4]